MTAKLGDGGNRSILMWLAAAVLVFGPLGWVAGPSRGDSHEKGEGDLHETMERINDEIRTLRRSVRDAEKDADSLKAIAKLQELSLAAKAMVPEKVRQMPEAEQAAQMREYRKQMSQVLGELCTMEVAVLEGRHDDAYESVKTLYKMKSTGHEQFQ